jgi:hypothetical protein
MLLLLLQLPDQVRGICSGTRRCLCSTPKLHKGKQYENILIGKSLLTELFDLKHNKFYSFLMEVKERSQIYNWSGIINVDDEDGDKFSLVESYEQVKLSGCHAHAATYINNATWQDISLSISHSTCYALPNIMNDNKRNTVT